MKTFFVNNTSPFPLVVYLRFFTVYASTWYYIINWSLLFKDFENTTNFILLYIIKKKDLLDIPTKEQ